MTKPLAIKPRALKWGERICLYYLQPKCSTYSVSKNTLEPLLLLVLQFINSSLLVLMRVPPLSCESSWFGRAIGHY